jgi:hypothetical protein
MMKKGVALLLISVLIFSFIGCKKDSSTEENTNNSTNNSNNKAPAAPYSPVPADKSTNQLIDLSLTWTCSDPDGDALSYDVYFSTSSSPSLAESSINSSAYTPTTLIGNTVYYWKIVAKDSHGSSTEGPVWSFTTAKDPARQKVLMDFNNIYIPTQTFTVGWTGSTSSCNPGTVSPEVQNKTIQTINYFRTLVGLPGDIILDNDESIKAQVGALMCTANNELNHKPPNTWLCFTTDGYDATSHSNLAWNAVGPAAIRLYINDFGTGNEMIGHRRWVLFSKLAVVGHGCTNNYDDLYVIGKAKPSLPPNMPEFVSYPPKGYIPAPLVFGRWSFSIPSADFTNATVTMTDQNSGNVTLTVISKTANGYGDNTIVWEPVGINTSSSTDVTYNVKVNSVKVGSDTKNYEYNVIIVKPGTKSNGEEDYSNSKVL